MEAAKPAFKAEAWPPFVLKIVRTLHPRLSMMRLESSVEPLSTTITSTAR